MNCSQYTYGQTQPMDQMQSRDMTTRPMGSMDMNTGRMGMQHTPMNAGRMAGMQAPPMSAGRMTQGTMTMQGAAAPMSAPPGGWNLPSTNTQPLALQTPTTVESPYYTAGFLRNFIGKTMRVEFIIGTSGTLVDRTGELVEVGASYIVLKPAFTDDLLMCDLYAIKFVTIYG